MTFADRTGDYYNDNTILRMHGEQRVDHLGAFTALHPCMPPLHLARAL